ncbi:hypothetical protein [Nonomuraea diastatica]|nr:hypothetical protein [Nonomuraea diastatica]
MAGGPGTALRVVDRLDLDGYLSHSTRGALLCRLGRTPGPGCPTAAPST